MTNYAFQGVDAASKSITALAIHFKLQKCAAKA